MKPSTPPFTALRDAPHQATALFTIRLKHLLPALTAAVVLGCGGGGGGGGGAPSSSSTNTTAPTAPIGLVATDFSVSSNDWGGDSGGDSGVGGAAGDGAPIKRAGIILLDRNGRRLLGQTDDNGNYLISVSGTLAAPIAVKVIDSGGKVLTSVINETITSGIYKRAMINPLTDKIVSDSLVSGVSGTDKSFDGSKVDPSKLDKAVGDLRTSIQSALSTAGVTNTTAFNPISDPYAYNGTGVDTVLDSIAHTRNPATGSTELRAKLAGLNTDANGVVQPTLVTAAAPLATTQLATAANGALNFDKLNKLVNHFNYCLGRSSSLPNDPICEDEAKLVHPNYKHNGKDFDEDFLTLLSESDRSGVRNSTVRNPVVLFQTRSAGSQIDDIAVVEFTIRQPRTGPLAGSIATPIEYTKIVVFRRDDVTSGLHASNWVFYGNQRNFDWSIEPRYGTLINKNPARDNLNPGGVPSRTQAGIRLNFSTSKFNYAQRNTPSRGYLLADVFAVRLKGPGLPASGIVFAQHTASGTPYFAILNKTGVIPAPGTSTPRVQSDFRISGALYPSGSVFPLANWPGNPTGGNLPHYSDDPSAAAFSALKAFNQYTAEIFTNSAPGTPIIETTSMLAPVEAPSAYVQRPLHDLSPSLPLITPPSAALSGGVTTNWLRHPEAVKIESSFFLYENPAGSQFVSSVNLPDRASLNPSSTSAAIPLSFSVPAHTAAVAGAREVGLQGRSGRASFTQSFYWNN